MKEIGEILHLAKSGRLILRSTAGNIDNNETGKWVVDEKGKRIGKIVEIFGPVRLPYASIAPVKGKRNIITGIKVFISDEDVYGSKKFNKHSKHRPHFKKTKHISD
ncbi:MAG TPA: Gar1/Naf1 family protein [Nitrososphaeraceae archaeon]|jgi:RNA-binding protein